jgi:hypothetical protein
MHRADLSIYFPGSSGLFTRRVHTNKIRVHTRRCVSIKYGDTTMFTNTKIALAAALIFGSACAALAADSGENHQDNDRSVSSGRAANSSYSYAPSPAHGNHTAHEQNQSR